MDAPLRFARLTTDAGGESRFDTISIDVAFSHFAPPAAPFGVSELAPASQTGFLKLPAGWVGETHPSPIRMWVFFLSGEMLFEASDGETRKCAAGTAMLLEDTTGRGHNSRVVGDSHTVLAVVRL